MAVIAPAIFILAAVFAIAGPILYRSLFAHRQRKLVKVPQVVMYKFERNLTGMALVAPYLALGRLFSAIAAFSSGGNTFDGPVCCLLLLPFSKTYRV